MEIGREVAISYTIPEDVALVTGQLRRVDSNRDSNSSDQRQAAATGA